MKSLFADIAARYDRMNRLMSLALDRRWRRRALADASLPPRGAALDLACGTGDFAAEIHRLCPEPQITGIDLTPEMLAVARAKLGNVEGLRFQVGDAQNLTGIPDGAFGIAVCAFGFRNFPDKAKALAECRRVLKPDGELIVLELFRPTFRLLGALVNAWLSLVAFLFARDARAEYAYLRRSVATTMSADAFVALAEANGFTLLHRRFLFPAATSLTFKPRP